VVIDGCVRAEPRDFGWGVVASLPLGWTRRLSFSIPRVIPVSNAALSGPLKRASLVVSDKVIFRSGRVGLVGICSHFFRRN
jgi:hypothetical protein